MNNTPAGIYEYSMPHKPCWVCRARDAVSGMSAQDVMDTLGDTALGAVVRAISLVVVGFVLGHMWSDVNRSRVTITGPIQYNDAAIPNTILNNPYSGGRITVSPAYSYGSGEMPIYFYGGDQ